MGDKLYVITRKDLLNGQQAVQAIHAAIEFCLEKPEIAKCWHDDSNYIAFLAAENEKELNELITKASSLGIEVSVFREPDLDNATTAIVLEPGVKSKVLCRNLSLAFK